MKVVQVLLLATSIILMARGVRAACTVNSLVAGLENFVRNAVSSNSQDLAAVDVQSQNIVCLATAAARNTYRQSSVVVNCTGPGTGTTANACPPASGLSQWWADS